MGPRISKEGSEERHDVEARVNQKRSKGGMKKSRAKHRDPRKMRSRSEGGRTEATKERRGRPKQGESNGEAKEEKQRRNIARRLELKALLGGFGVPF